MTEVIGTTPGQKRQEEYMRRAGTYDALDKNAFLELLITQLRYQDPLNPKDNGEFLAQMAQFTALEQMQNLNVGMEKLLKEQQGYREEILERVDRLAEALEELLEYNMISRLALTADDLVLLGKEVTLVTHEGEEVTGTVTAVTFGERGGRLVVDGREYNAAQILRVSEVKAKEQEPESEAVSPLESADMTGEVPEEQEEAEQVPETGSGETDDGETEI